MHSTLQEPSPSGPHLVPTLSPSVVDVAACSSTVEQSPLRMSPQCPACNGDSHHTPTWTLCLSLPFLPWSLFSSPISPSYCQSLPGKRFALIFNMDHSFPHFYDFQCDKMTLLTSKPFSSPTFLHSVDVFLAN